MKPKGRVFQFCYTLHSGTQGYMNYRHTLQTTFHIHKLYITVASGIPMFVGSRLFQALRRTLAVAQPASVAVRAAVSPCCLRKSTSLRRRACARRRKLTWLFRAPRPRTTASWRWPTARMSGWVSTIARWKASGWLPMGNVERSRPPQPGGYRTSRPAGRTIIAFSCILAPGVIRIVTPRVFCFPRCVSFPVASSLSVRSADRYQKRRNQRTAPPWTAACSIMGLTPVEQGRCTSFWLRGGDSDAQNFQPRNMVLLLDFSKMLKQI